MRYQRSAARLRGPVAVCFGAMQICDSSSLCISGPCKAATARRCVFRALQNLRQLVAVCFGAMQSCDSPSLCVLSCCKTATARRCAFWAVAKAATARRCVFRGHAKLRRLVAVYFGRCKICDSSSLCVLKCTYHLFLQIVWVSILSYTYSDTFARKNSHSAR